MDQDMDINLRWNEHQTTLLSVFSSLLGNENLVDCTISAEGQCFKAHRVILSACSPYFDLIFSEHCEKHPIIILPDVQFQILKVLMEYMYSGEVKVPQNELTTVLELAEALQIKGLSSVSEIQNDIGRKSRNESSILCDQRGFEKYLHELRYGSQVKQKDVSSLLVPKKESSEEIDPCHQAAQISEKNSSNSVSQETTIEEAAMFQDISDTETFSVFRGSSVTKTRNKSNSPVSGTLLNSVSNILDSGHLSGCSKVNVGEKRMLSENVISTQLTGEELRISEPVGVFGERSATDLLPQMKQEYPDDFNSTSIEEIILDDDSDECGNRDSGSGDGNSNTDGLFARVTLEQSLSGPDFCSREQFRYAYFVEPASILPNPYNCNVCGRSYHHPQGLWRHSRFECGKEPQFSCSQCPRRLFHKYHLQRHILRAQSPY